MVPRAPEGQGVIDRHITWWKMVHLKNMKQGFDTIIKAEFGPAPYLPLLPYTQMPVYSQWEVNVYMMHLLRTGLK